MKEGKRMYCSSCGAAVAQGLRYCNRCGEKLNGAKEDGLNKPSESLPDSLIWAIVAVFIVGLGTTIGLMAMMKELLNFSNRLIIAFAALSFLLMFVLEGVFIWLLLRRKREEREVVENVKEQKTKELDAAQARALPEPVPSIIEDTTRSFEPIYSERRSK